MHEVALMQETLDIALAHARRGGATRVHALTLRIGPLAGVEIDALRLAFEVATADTPADGAALCLEEVPIACWCAACDRSFEPADNVFRCPQCLALSGDIRQGREFDLVAVEVS